MKGRALSEWRHRAAADPLDLLVAQEGARPDVFARLFETVPLNILITALQQEGLWPGRPSPWAVNQLQRWRSTHDLSALYQYVKDGKKDLP